MKDAMTIKKWQLLRWRKRSECADLRECDFVAVGRRAFYQNRRVEEVLLPANASVIKTEAFSGCRSLSRVVLPSDNGVGIAGGAFANCSRLRTLENTALISRIGARAFENCTFLPDPLGVRVSGFVLSYLHEGTFGHTLRVLRADTEGGYLFRTADADGTVCLEAFVRTEARQQNQTDGELAR